MSKVRIIIFVLQVKSLSDFAKDSKFININYTLQLQEKYNMLLCILV